MTRQEVIRFEDRETLEDQSVYDRELSEVEQAEQEAEKENASRGYKFTTFFI